MAGAGYKLFNTGDVLTAAQVNTYLMEQTVMVFADAAARTTALTGVVSEGMISYLKDTNAVEVYNGSAWVSSDDPNAIQNTIVDAKGDLITATAADTPARLAVGNNGETLVADSSASTGLRYQPNFAAGKNKIINGDFNIWQRGTSFTNPGNATYTADRSQITFDGTGATRTVSRQTFTPGTAPVAGYEGNYFYRLNQTAAGSGNTIVDTRHKIENVTSLAGQTVTVSFWAKAASNTTITVVVDQDFGSGGSSRVFNAIPAQGFTVTTSWQRFTHTGTMASIAGKTIGTSSYVDVILRTDATGGTFTMDIWGWQVEAANTATAFQTATGTIQGELSAAQRYYYRIGGDSTVNPISMGIISASTNAQAYISLPVSMRVPPTSVEFSTLKVSGGSMTARAVTSVTLNQVGKTYVDLTVVCSGGTFTNGAACIVQGDGSTSNFLGLSAEL